MLDTVSFYEELAEVTAMERMRKQMGWSESEFYACSRLKKLPIFDEAHVRNAMARFNQTMGMTPEEKSSAKGKIASAAKKFGIKVDEFEKLSEELNLTDKSYIIKRATLMSAGKWNNNNYTADEIKKAFESTDWNYPNNRYLYLEHQDGGVGAWIGEVVKPYFDNDSLYGDIVIHDPIWSAKMKNGKPRFGISPRLRGNVNDKDNTVKDFLFENFSLVQNPAVKTTFFNNAAELEGCEMDKIEEPKGVSEIRLKEIIDAELKEIDDFNKINKKTEPIEEVKSMDSLADLFELYELKGLNLAKITRKAAELRVGEATLSEIDAIKRAAKLLEEEGAKLKASEVDASKAAELKEKETRDAEVNKLKEEVKTLTEKLNEPATTKVIKTLGEKQLSKDADAGMLKFLKDIEEGTIYG